MRRPIFLFILLGAGFLMSLWLLLQTPGSLSEALSNPFEILIGTQRQINATLLEVSENAEPVRAAGLRLFQPLGRLRLVQLYDSGDSDASKKH